MSLQTRRAFLGSCVAVAGAAAFARTTLGAPRLKVGVLSDIHLSPPDVLDTRGSAVVFEKILEYYKHEGVDVVLIAGDFTNGGRVRELEETAKSWRKVFGKGPAPERVFVTGNHEKCYYDLAKQKGDFAKPHYAEGIYRDVRKYWKEVLGETWEPFFIKRVKGYSFIGAHWHEWMDEKALRAFFAAHKKELVGSKPFFYVQHAHPKNTCYGSWTWDQESGGPTADVLADYPNAVAFSGHTHYSLADERSVWQGAFTSIGTAALRCVYVPSGRENSGVGTRMDWMRGGGQGQLMSVWDDRLVLERYDLYSMEKIGEDWVVPILKDKTSPRAFAFDVRRAKARAPEFPAGAKLSFKLRPGKDPNGAEETQVVVSFPAAKGYGDSMSRPFEYELAAECVETDFVRPMCVKRVYQPGVLQAPNHDAKTVACVFGRTELPTTKFRLVVTPRNSFGVCGKSIVHQFGRKPEFV